MSDTERRENEALRALNADLTRQLNEALGRLNRPHGETPRTALFAAQYAPYDNAKSAVDWPQCIAQWKAFAEKLERETETWRDLVYTLNTELAQAEQHIRALENP